MISTNDIRFGLRMLVKQPAFTLVAVLTLALGIGANSAIFSVVNGVLLRPLPYGEPDRLVVVWETEGARDTGPASAANFLDWRDQNQVFDGLTAVFPQPVTLTGGDEPERLRGLQVTPNFFQLLGVNPVAGRSFSTDEDATGRRAVVLSHEFWQRQFGARPDVIGDTLSLDGEVYSIVGVMPAGFQYATEQADVWVRPPRDIPVPPIDLGDEADILQERGLHWLQVVARLAPGVTLDEAQAEMEVIASRLANTYPDDNTGRGINLVPMHEQLVGDVRPALVVLLGAVGFVLLIACANVANLLLSRASGREREVAIRATLGASRARLVRQFLAESLLLSLLGGALGLVLAFWGMDLILAMSPDVLPRISVIELDVRVLAFTLGISILTGLIFGLLPAIQSTRADLQDSLKDGGRGSGGRERRRLRSFLVVTEVGLALVLLICAGLMMKSFFLLQDVDPGFNSDNVLTLRLWLPEAKYDEESRVAGFYDQVLERVADLPGVASASAVLSVPLSGSSANFSFVIEGRPEPAPGEDYAAGFQSVSSGYFRTMGIPLLKGRDFSERDDAEAPKVLVINQALAGRYWSGEDPVGRRISLDEEEWIEIVGVAGNVLHNGLDREPRPEIYLPYQQSALRFMTLVVKSHSDPMSLVAAVRSQVLAVDPDLPVYKVMSLDEIVAESVARPRFNMFLLAIFSALALVLAAIGIYGLMSFSVSQRTHEIGIRLAMGARSGDVFKLVVGEGMALALAGLALGLAVAWAITRYLSSMLFGVTTTDPWTFAGVCLVLAAVALVAVTLPARRATRVDPLVALRYE